MAYNPPPADSVDFELQVCEPQTGVANFELLGPEHFYHTPQETIWLHVAEWIPIKSPERVLAESLGFGDACIVKVERKATEELLLGVACTRGWGLGRVAQDVIVLEDYGKADKWLMVFAEAIALADVGKVTVKYARGGAETVAFADVVGRKMEAKRGAGLRLSEAVDRPWILSRAAQESIKVVALPQVPGGSSGYPDDYSPYDRRVTVKKLTVKVRLESLVEGGEENG